MILPFYRIQEVRQKTCFKPYQNLVTGSHSVKAPLKAVALPSAKNQEYHTPQCNLWMEVQLEFKPTGASKLVLQYSVWIIGSYQYQRCDPG